MKQSDGGKGSLQRPTNKKKFDEGYDRIFNKKEKVDDKSANSTKRRFNSI